jgi:hypothetical protein
MWQIKFVFVLRNWFVVGKADRTIRRKINTIYCYLLSPDDGLQMGSKHAQAW